MGLLLVASVLYNHMSKKKWLEGTGPELSILKFAVNPYISLSLGNTNMVGGGGGGLCTVKNYQRWPLANSDRISIFQ